MVRVGLTKAFKRPAYLTLALMVSGTIFALTVWLPNLRLIIEIMGHPSVSLAQKIELPLSLLGSIATNFTTLSALSTVLIAILFGMNVAMLVYLVRSRAALLHKSGAATGTLGLLSGIFGIGCAACGSLIVTSVLSLLGAGGALAYLPLRGAEFGLIGVALLLWSTYALSKRIGDPLICST